jgi:hypothetical protein
MPFPAVPAVWRDQIHQPTYILLDPLRQSVERNNTDITNRTFVSQLGEDGEHFWRNSLYMQTYVSVYVSSNNVLGSRLLVSLASECHRRQRDTPSL